MKVVFIDDCPVSLETIGLILEDSPHEVFLKHTPEGISSINPDLVVLDMYMPDRSGLDVCRQLKLDEVTRDIPVIMLSSSFDRKDKMDCFGAGAIDYLEKPIGREALINAINAYASIGVVVKASKHIQQGLRDDTREEADCRD